MIEYKDAHLVTEGTALVAQGTRTVDWLTYGKEYYALDGVKFYIFSDRPFVSVMADDGKKHTYHLSRFKFPTTDEQNA